MKKRTSLIWLMDKEKLIEIVSKAISISEILSHFGMRNKGGNYAILKQRLEEDGLNYSHIKLGIYSNRGRSFIRRKIPLEDILVEKSTFNRNHLKIRLLKENILLNECAICKQPPLWNGKSLSLQLDHINGIGDDNRLENLRILCPHCHSQTENFAGKNKRRNNAI
jgi:Zn finger protein HypA/HybF involved in hydrogenase expression